MWLARFPVACGLFDLIIALFATGSGDDNAPTSNSSGQAIAAYAATHQVGAFAGLGEVALLALAVFVVALYTALSRGQIAREAATKLGSFPAFLPRTAGGRRPISPWRAMLQMNGYAFEITLFAQALLLSAVAIGGLVSGASHGGLAPTATVLAVASCRVVSAPQRDSPRRCDTA
jgi:hypothetical protein